MYQREVGPTLFLVCVSKLYLINTKKCVLRRHITSKNCAHSKMKQSMQSVNHGLPMFQIKTKLVSISVFLLEYSNFKRLLTRKHPT